MTTVRRAGRRNRRAAWTLVVLTPLIAELALGSTPIRMAWLVLLWVPIYGAGVLLIRELVVRRGRGWPSILLLAAAYELLEDGIGLQALTSPHLYDAAGWGLRVLGFNLPYWVANTIYHAVFTVAVPIALTDLLFPAHRRRTYLGRTGTAVAAVITGLGVLVLRVTVSMTQDPGYQAPLPFVVGCLVAVVALAVVALVVLPPDRPVAGPAPVPDRRTLALASGVATLVLIGLTFPLFGARQPAFSQGAVVLVPLVAAAIVACVAYRLLAGMASAPGWTDRHTLAVVGGALVGHSLVGVVAIAKTTVDRLGLVAIIALTVAALAFLDRRLRSRPLTPQ